MSWKCRQQALALAKRVTSLKKSFSELGMWKCLVAVATHIRQPGPLPEVSPCPELMFGPGEGVWVRGGHMQTGTRCCRRVARLPIGCWAGLPNPKSQAASWTGPGWLSWLPIGRERARGKPRWLRRAWAGTVAVAGPGGLGEGWTGESGCRWAVVIDRASPRELELASSGLGGFDGDQSRGNLTAWDGGADYTDNQRLSRTCMRSLARARHSGRGPGV